MPLEPEDIEAIKAIIAESAAATATTTQAAIAAATQRIAAVEVAADLAKAEAAKAAEADADATPPSTENAAADPKIAALEAQVAKLSRMSEEADKRAKAAIEASNLEKMDNGLRQALVAAGASGEHIDSALLVFKASNDVTLKDGQVAISRKNEYGADELVSAADGAEAFFKTGTGKVFLPATSAGNADSQGFGADNGEPSGTMDPMRVIMDALA